MTPGRSLYINLGLTAGLLLLAAAVWLAPAPREPYFKPFAHIDAEKLSRIEILVLQQPPALLQRQSGAWIVPDAPDAALDPQRLRNLLNILNESVTQAYDAGGLDLKEFGLEPPAIVLKLDDHDFRFGASEPLSRRRYVLYASKLYLLTDTHYPLLSRGLGNLILQQPAAGNGSVQGLPKPAQPELSESGT